MGFATGTGDSMRAGIVAHAIQRCCLSGAASIFQASCRVAAASVLADFVFALKPGKECVCARDSFAPVQLRLEFRKACLGAHASAAILCLTRSGAPRDELRPLNPVD
jgi:hypothetical protein